MVLAIDLSILLFKKRVNIIYYLLIKLFKIGGPCEEGCMKRKTPPLTYPPTHSTLLAQHLTSNNKESFNSLSQAKPWGWLVGWLVGR